MENEKNDKKQTEFSEMMRTLRHHYLWKVYLPMYRLIHMTPEQRFRNKNDCRIMNVTTDHNHTRLFKTGTCVAPAHWNLTQSPIIRLPSSKRYIMLKHNRSRNCVHIMKLIPEYPNLNNNGDVISPASSLSSSRSSTPSSSPESSPPPTPRSLTPCGTRSPSPLSPSTTPPLLSPTDLEHYAQNSMIFYSRHIIESKFHEHLRRKYRNQSNSTHVSDITNKSNDLKTLILQSRRNDREEIRRKLAMGSDDSESTFYTGGGGGLKKPSLPSRLQSGMHLHGNNLQICFMNEATDQEGLTEQEDKVRNF